MAELKEERVMVTRRSTEGGEGEREGKEGGDQEGKGSGSTEENSIILNQVTKVHWGWGDESATVMVPVVNDTAEDLVLWAGMPLVRLEELEGGQEDEIEVDAEALKESWEAKKEEEKQSAAEKKREEAEKKK